LEDRCKKNLFDRAVDIFKKLEMHKTALRNGVLFYVAVNDRKFVIIGDAGINAKVPEGFWNEIKELVFGYFKDGKIADGLMEGIRLTGESLNFYFPREAADVDELSNEISYGELE
jgi:uncharacterized membrane protein